MFDDGQPTGAVIQDSPNAEAQKPAESTQHVDVEKIVRERLARDRRNRESEYQSKALAAVGEKLGLELASIDDLDSLREVLEKSRGTESEAKSIARKLDKLTAELRSRDDQLAQYRARDRQRTIVEAVTRHATAAIRPDQVVKLIADRFDISEDGDVIVIDEKGKPTDKSPAKFIEDFLGENPHLLRPTAPTGGAASRPGSDGKQETKSDLLTPEGRKAAMAAFFAQAGKV